MAVTPSKRFGALVLVAALAVGTTACGDDGGDQAAGPDLDRYCELAAELDALGEDIDIDENATEEQIGQALGQFVEENQGKIDELQRVAPTEIQEEVTLLADAFQEVGETGSFEVLESEEVSQAEDEITTFEDENCPNAGGDEQASGDVQAFCEAAISIETAPEPEIDFEAATPDEQAQAAKDFFADLVPLAEEAQANAPEEIADAVQVGVDAITAGADTGDFAPFESEEFEQAQQELFAFYQDNCDVNTVDVTAVDYGYEGMPATISGDQPVLLNFTNEGDELHEGILIRKNDDTPESFQELLQLPQEEAMAKTTFAGAVFAEPGDDGPGIVELEPGEYAMICFIPVGTTSEDAEVDGPPHFTRGMVTEFTVE